jgi:hypothetical protein
MVFFGRDKISPFENISVEFSSDGLMGQIQEDIGDLIVR